MLPSVASLAATGSWLVRRQLTAGTLGRWLVLAGLGLFTLGTVSPAGAQQNAGDAATVERLLDQQYSDVEGRPGKCDVYLPGGDPPADGWPVVIVVHGGGWRSGDKWTMTDYSRSLAERGVAAININYRLAPAYRFPAQVDDVRSALVWTAENAERFSLDLDRLGLFGYSAGGHLTTLAGVLADEPDHVQRAASNWTADDVRWKRLPEIHAVCAGGPFCDFRPLPPANTTLAYFLGGSRAEKPTVYDIASPTVHASGGDPVTQIVHGETDMIVPVESSRSLHDALISIGVDCRYKLIPGQGHLITFLHPQTKATVLAFFAEVFQLAR